MAEVSDKLVLEKINSLPAISPAVFELINIIRDFNTPKSQIVFLVSTDQVLVGSIFKFANSPALGFGKKVETVDEAIEIIGLNYVADLVVSIAAKGVFNFEGQWFDSLFTAFATSEFAKMLDKSKEVRSKLYMAGLLSSVGSLLFKKFFNKEYREVLKFSTLKKQLIVEEEMFQINRIQLAVKILEHWKVPSTIIDIVKASHNPDLREYDLFSALLTLSEEIVFDLAKIQKDEYLVKELLDNEKYYKGGLGKLRVTQSIVNSMYDKAKEFQQIF